MRKFVPGDRIALHEKTGEVLAYHGHSFDRDIYRVRFDEGEKLVSHVNMKRARIDEGVRLAGAEAQAAFQDSPDLSATPALLRRPAGLAVGLALKEPAPPPLVGSPLELGFPAPVQ